TTLTATGASAKPTDCLYLCLIIQYTIRDLSSQFPSRFRKNRKILNNLFLSLLPYRELSAPNTSATALCTADDKERSNKFKVLFNRQQMADYLNVNRVAMCGELSKMQKDGLIKFHKFDFEIFFGNR
ncbi:MAG: winged helix-turn-helix domain-containing protein, partial [Abditibacteriota bacterium]|nr:winged helix-turn-helix domain-containing protein [Abditibacteriota bacterium]